MGKLCSTGFLLNLLGVFLELCGPFMMNSAKFYGNFEKITPLYCGS